ncbi:hypothetical protein Back11_11490 [Paenibacillus baekrokdamisoli]|uniref:Uncharacterized protein n=1 Tax=Paenibacillus baekrokdamisoli TaxID=1712516 RepID=A0A3G9J942_9BACL|nr:RNA helicase [Paenibacillus baekrokdamisoli]MBB3070450.1 hypothetical protein [Paenibacillus baekrokdamisoli]BBH19804.1 hypothetical protein Back11_11490 [Paenibacillus baekrokdamisoli]
MTDIKQTLEIGFIMPIAAIDGCSAEHWTDVRNIITEAVASITKYKCTSKIVSESEDVGVIQKRIVQNIYNADVVVCDVSCKNANVMFELGMRLAFDKPTIIIKDVETGFSFDTQVIEHLIYPRDLRFSKIVEFKENLARKIVATYENSINDPEHSTFLKNFGQFKVAALEETTVTPDNLIISMLGEIQSEISVLKRYQTRPSNREQNSNKSQVSLADIQFHVKLGVVEYSNKQKLSLNDLKLYVDSGDLSALLRHIKEYVKREFGNNHFVDDAVLIEFMHKVLQEIGVAS